jgi:Putative gypsy type transposon
MSKLLKKGKAAAGAAAEASVMKKAEGDWAKSSVKKTDLEILRAQGLLPPADQAAVRAPGKEVFPSAREGERVCFVEFLPRGFGFPLHDFVRGLLYAYGIQIHDLTPNSVLSIASFIVLCECFLGIAPNWMLWKSLFIVRRNVGKSQ